MDRVATAFLAAWIVLLHAGAAAGHLNSTAFVGRVLLSPDGRTRGMVLPLKHQPGQPRALLRKGSLAIHGAVREGYFYAQLALGTPPRTYSVIIDTGSTITYVPCADCTHCGKHMAEAFDPSKSSTAQVLPCGHASCNCGSPPCSCYSDKCFYQRHYAERSSSEGWLVLDKFSFPDGAPPVDVTFGCGTRETGEIFRQAADGILGMGNNANALHSQLARAGVTSRVFSLCFGFPAGGTLLLGDVAMPAGVGPLSYTPLLPSSTPYYVVKLEALAVAGRDLAVDAAKYAQGYGSVLDSGTTFSYLPTAAFAAFSAALDAALVGKGLKKGGGPDPAYPDVCYSGAPEKFEDAAPLFPTAQMRFAGGAALELPPHRYLFVMGRGEYCLGVFDNGDAGTLIGGIATRNTVVTYDLECKRVGFADADCPNLGSAVAAEPADAAAAKPAPTPAAAPPTVPQPAAAGATAAAAAAAATAAKTSPPPSTAAAAAAAAGGGKPSKSEPAAQPKAQPKSKDEPESDEGEDGDGVDEAGGGGRAGAAGGAAQGGAAAAPAAAAAAAATAATAEAAAPPPQQQPAASGAAGALAPGDRGADGGGGEDGRGSSGGGGGAERAIQGGAAAPGAGAAGRAITVVGSGGARGSLGNGWVGLMVGGAGAAALVAVGYAVVARGRGGEWGGALRARFSRRGGGEEPEQELTPLSGGQRGGRDRGGAGEDEDDELEGGYGGGGPRRGGAAVLSGGAL